jgi:hypothetical protein
LLGLSDAVTDLAVNGEGLLEVIFRPRRVAPAGVDDAQVA